MMERYVDLFLDRLFKMAERVVGGCDTPQSEVLNISNVKPVTPTIRFSHEDRMVEGELFK